MIGVERPVNINFKELKKVLAENKVFDAWQYVYSLCETMSYMEASFELLTAVYDYRKRTLKNIEQEIFKQALAHRGQPATLTTKHLEQTNLNIAGYELNDAIFLRKTALEFFHYARVSVEVLSQIVNASLFGDSAFHVSENGLPVKVLRKLDERTTFSNLKAILQNGIDDSDIDYLFAFDNYTKHIKTILITVSNSFFIGNTDTFEINAFHQKGKTYPRIDAIKKVIDVKNVIEKLIEDVLNEIIAQVPNCIDNTKRFHTLKFKQVFKETDGGSILQYMVYFIEVKEDLNEIPSEINVMPLMIQSGGDICSYVLDLDEIFITIEGKAEQGIIGIARFSGNGDSNDLYRTYIVEPCTMHEFHKYVATFHEKYNRVHINANAIAGEIISIRE